MLDEDLTLKITDWGQAHKINLSLQAYQMAPNDDAIMPIRWMAPEAILTRHVQCVCV